MSIVSIAALVVLFAMALQFWVTNINIDRVHKKLDEIKRRMYGDAGDS